MGTIIVGPPLYLLMVVGSLREIRGKIRERGLRDEVLIDDRTEDRRF